MEVNKLVDVAFQFTVPECCHSVTIQAPRATSDPWGYPLAIHKPAFLERIRWEWADLVGVSPSGCFGD